MNIEQQIRKILKSNNILNSKHSLENSSSDKLRDIYDGRIYQNLYEKFKNKFNNREMFTFLLNTDGIAISDSSKLTMWPVYLVINELPLETRFTTENIILAGIFLQNFL